MRTNILKLLAGGFNISLFPNSSTLAANKSLGIDGNWSTGQIPQVNSSDSTKLNWVEPHRINYNPPLIMTGRSTNTSISITGGTFAILPFDTTSADPYSQYNTSTYTFTCASNCGGYYLIDSFITLDIIAASYRFILSVYKNGSEVARLSDLVYASGGYPAMGGSTVVKFNAGDTASLRLYNGGTTNTFTLYSAFSRFNMTKLSGN